MKSGFSAMTLAVALILAGCGDDGGNLTAAAANSNAPLPQIPAPNNGNWAEMVTRTPEGGFLMGNPNAPVKLVEYASYTCPHCATFAQTAGTPLRETYVRSGQVSWELRSFLRGPQDVALTLLVECMPPDAVFGTADQVFERQQELLSAIDETEGRTIQALPPEQMLPPLARAMDLDTFFARRGIPESRFNQCIGDRQALQRLEDMNRRAINEQQVQVTPTFLINGEKITESEWPGVEQRLRAAIGG